MESHGDDLTSYGSRATGTESSEEISLVQDLERELGAVVQRHRIPPDELQQLFEVVQRMFNLMDSHREAYERMEMERNELNERWEIEKDNLRKLKTYKIELESEHEEEVTKIEQEKLNLEKRNAVLETKVKQLVDQRQNIELELQHMREKHTKDETTRQELIDQYKKQLEQASTQQNIRRTVLHRMQSPMFPREPIINLLKKKQFSASLGASARYLKPLEDSAESDVFMIGSMEVPLEEPDREAQDELEMKEAEKLHRQLHQEREEPPPPTNTSLEDEFKQLEEEKAREEEELKRREEELRLQEEMMVEVEMIQREKDNLQEEKKILEKDKADVVAQKETLERVNAELQVEVKGLKEVQEDLKERLTKVTKERDEVYDNYLRQPLSAYNISRKELHSLLMKQQATASELDTQRDQTLKYKQLYDESKRSYYERIKQKMWKLFSKQPVSSVEPVRYTPADSQSSSALALAGTPVTPLRHSIAMLLEGGKLVVENGWLMSSKSSVLSNTLPQWMGQVPLKSVMIERIESVELGRIYHSPPAGGEQSEVRLQAGLHAEVWVTTKDKSMSVACVNIEVIDILAMPPKLCQRFILKPETPHIVCMRSIPGIIEYSREESTSSDTLVGSSESHDQQQQLSDGSPSKSGSLEHGKGVLNVTDDLDQLDRKPSKSKPTSTSAVEMEGSFDEGHKHVSQEPLTSEGQDGNREKMFTDGETPIMWIITENNLLCFYPTTDPRHRPINIIKLESRATCMEYIHGKVFIGHEASTLTVYSKDESSSRWDLTGQLTINLPSYNPEVQNDIRCIAGVKDRVWIGAGPSIFFLCADSLDCEGSRFLNVEHFPPDQILPLGDAVAVAAKSSSIFIFDAETTNFLRTFDVQPMTKSLVTVEQASKWKEVRSPPLEKIPTIVKTMVADDTTLYVGTSQGMVVAVPITSLSGSKDLKDTQEIEETGQTKASNGASETATEENATSTDELCLDNCALALHVQKDSRVKSLLHLRLPITEPHSHTAESAAQSGHQYTSAVQAYSLTEGVGETSGGTTRHRSLIVSSGKGHMEYSDDPSAEDVLKLPPNYNTLREKNEEHQLLVWGHKLL